MFSDWTIDNTPAEPNLAIVTLGDLKIWLQKYTPPPPPPPAPTLQGSVYQFSAKLTWNAVAEADHYKITLDDTYDNQILTFTTTANQYIDWPRSPVVLTGSSSMPYLRYTVKTVTADNRESNPSNSIYFNYEVQ